MTLLVIFGIAGILFSLLATMAAGGHRIGSDREVHGWANGVPLCHPNAGLDCYRLVTVYREPVGARLPGGMLHGKPDPIRDPVDARTVRRLGMSERGNFGVWA